MISDQTARLAAKWWRNRLEALFNGIINNEDAKPDGYIEMMQVNAIKCFAKSNLDELDEFEDDLFNEICKFKKCKHLCLSSMDDNKYIIGSLICKHKLIIFPKAETYISGDKLYYKSADGTEDKVIITSPECV